MGTIALEVVTPRGTALRESRLDEVVFRRREPAFERGSEIAVLPRHGPLLATVCCHELRYRRGGRTGRLAVGPGVAEVLDDTVTLLVASAGSDAAPSLG